MEKSGKRAAACPGCQRKTVRDDETKKRLDNRLARIEGQIRGVRGMLDADAYCVDILTQVEAVRSALAGFSRELLAMHLSGCVKADLAAGRDEAADELVALLERMLK